MTRDRELLQRPGGAVRNLQGDIITPGNRGRARVSFKISAATQRAACAEGVARAGEEEVARLSREILVSSRVFDDGGEVRREFEVLHNRVEVFNDQLEYEEGAFRVARRGRGEAALKRARDDYEVRALDSGLDGRDFQRRRFELGGSGGFAS